MITFVATAYKESTESHIFICSLLLQTDPNWKCIIYCDGKNDYIRNLVNNFNDKRITLKESEENTGFWGHYNRKLSLDEVDTEFLIQTSIQDYYLPNMVAEINNCKNNYDMILFDCLHNHFDYKILNTRPIRCQVDWGTCVIRTEIAKKVGINHPESNICDGLFVEECIKHPSTRLFKIDKILTIHN